MKKLAPIRNIPERIIILSQRSIKRGRHLYAFVECPTCGKQFHKQRSGIREQKHTFCLACARVFRAFPIEENDATIVIDPTARHKGVLHALVICPDCGVEFLKSRRDLRRNCHTLCLSCAVYRTNFRPISDIPDQLIILEQDTGERSRGGGIIAEVQCPDCGCIRRVTKGCLSQTLSSRCNSCNQSGKKHWHWKGGVSYYRGPDWGKIASAIRQRDGHTCQYPGCQEALGNNGRLLDVHHIIPYRETQDNSSGNLIALCMSHHRWADHHLDESILLLKSIATTNCERAHEQQA